MYEAARAKFQDGQYDAAVALLRDVYACEANPIYLYDIARSYEQAGRAEDAIAAWRTYGAIVVDPLASEVAKDRIAALLKTLEPVKPKDGAEPDSQGGSEPAPRPPPLATPALVRARFPISAGAGIVAGIGAVGLVAGVVFGLLANSRHASAAQEASGGRAAELQRDATSFATASTWSFVAGGVVTGAGVTWATVDLLRPRSANAPSTPVIAIGGQF